MIDGNTKLIAHLGHPTHSFTAPLIYNPYFEDRGINATVMPMGVTRDHFRTVLDALRGIENFLGALITMPLKIDATRMVDRCSDAVRIAGSCNAIRRRDDGTLEGDLFDGEGFVRAARQRLPLNGCDALVIGCGGVGAAIAASLARADVKHLTLFDPDSPRAQKLADRLKARFATLSVTEGTNDPTGHGLVVNASPLGMKADDPLPVDVARLEPTALAADVVLSTDVTPFLRGAIERGCQIQVGTDMLYEQIPAYLEFFGFETTISDELKSLANLKR